MTAKLTAGVTMGYSLALLILMMTKPTVDVPPIPKSTKGPGGRAFPHEQLLKDAQSRFSHQEPIWFPEFLGRAQEIRAHMQHMIAVHGTVEKQVKSAKAGQKWKPGLVRQKIGEMKQTLEYIDASIEHHAQWVGKVHRQLYLAFGFGILGALLGFFGFLIPGGIACAMGAGAPLFYGVFSQPFPAEPLVFSGPLLIFGIILILLGVKARRARKSQPETA